PNPGTYDLSVHGPHGFFRRFAGSPATAVRVETTCDHRWGRLTLKVTGGSRKHKLVLRGADAYGPDRTLELRGDTGVTVDTGRASGWYDIALTTPGDASFAYQLAGRLESPGQLTSDPQLGRA